MGLIVPFGKPEVTEINAPAAGRFARLVAESGQAVDVGDVLVEIEAP